MLVVTTNTDLSAEGARIWASNLSRALGRECVVIPMCSGIYEISEKERFDESGDRNA